MESLQTQAAPVSSPSLFCHESGQSLDERKWSDWSAERPLADSSSWLLGSDKISSSPWAHSSMLARNLSGLPAFPHRRTDGEDENDDSSLFSSSLPNLFHTKMKLSAAEEAVNNFRSSMLSSRSREDDALKSQEELEAAAIGNLLPDEEELFDGIVDDYDYALSSSNYEDPDDIDLFSSGGGMELDFQDGIGAYINGFKISDVLGLQNPSNGPSVAGEHPYGEHPSRTLFVRNINSNVEDSELRSLFEQYGDIRTLYTACKHRGFVMISYYDIRSARSAMRALQNRPLRRRKLDIHFSIPKDNPSDKDVNQGTLVVFNLDASVSNEDLRQIFGAYGEVKEIRETPHKRHHKFIEFYDVRSAEAALRALNRSDIAGKRIKLEPSRPGGARRSSIIQQLTQEQEDSAWSSSPPGHPSQWNGYNQTESGAAMHPGSFANKTSHSPPVRNGVIGSHSGKHGVFPPHHQSLPEYSTGAMTSANSYVSGTSLLSGASSAVFRTECFEGSHLKRASTEIPFGHIGSVRGGANVSSSNTPASSLSSQQFLWGTNINNPHGSSAWPASFGHGSPLYSAVLSGHVPGSAPSAEYLSDSLDTRHLQNGISHLNGGLSRSEQDPSSPSFGMFSSHHRSHLFPSHFVNNNFSDFGRLRRADANVQMDMKKQFQLDLERILNGEDTRTTLMIKNIPNKYTSKMLLAAIDELHRGTYDFIYLPIDFKNKCNVGYAFINMISSLSIIPFYQAFHGKKWEKFNSEKVASLAYARIQGKAALVAHFQNSSLMNEDKRCRPILFHSDGPNAGDQEPFPVSMRIRSGKEHNSSCSNSSNSSSESQPDESTLSSPKDELFNGGYRGADSQVVISARRL